MAHQIEPSPARGARRAFLRSRAVAGLAVLTSLALLASACGYHQESTAVQVADPGRCVPVDIAASSVMASLLGDAASRFNGSSAARFATGGCAFVRVETVDAPVVLRELTDNWPDSATLGPAPVAWVPESTMWGELLNARLADQHRPPMAPEGVSIARSPLVVAMPAPMAKALGEPDRPIAWADLAALAANPRGWAAFGHPEWGPFRLGKGNPNWSTSGLDQTVALDAASATAFAARALERAVVYYGTAPGDSTGVYFDTWQRLSAKSPASALTYLSALVTDERSVVAYNTGHAPGDVALTGHGHRPKVPLVAIYPTDASIDGDNPVIPLDVRWSSAAARAGVRQFTDFALRPTTQAKVAAAGFRPAQGALRANVLNDANGVDVDAHTNSVAPASPAAVEHALTNWQAIRKPARVLFLFDVSDSMGDPADPAQPHGPTKLVLAQRAATDAIHQLAPGDEVGLRIFSSKLPNSPNPDWRDLVPIGPLATRHAALDSAIAALTPQQGSALYTATRDAFDAVAAHADPQQIDGVVLLTDGYNEDDSNTDLHGLLVHLTTNRDVHIFTVTYSNDADLATLVKIAQATNAANSDARDTRDLADLLPRAFASF